jgi:hypothetical protein
VVNKITPADISDPGELIARAKALGREFGTPIAPGFEALVFKASRAIEDIYGLTKLRKDGSRFQAVVSVTALRDAEDVIIGYLLIGTDNTAGKQVEEERMKLDQRLRDQHFYVLTEGKVTNYELTARARDGTLTVVSYNATTFHDCDRNLQGVFSRSASPTSGSAFRRTGWSSCSSRSVKSFDRDRFTAEVRRALSGRELVA